MKIKTILEDLAEIEHEQWMQWANSVKGEVNPERAKRWESYMEPYSELPKEVKDKDRKWARKVLISVMAVDVSLSKVVKSEDIWVVHVSLIEGPISWTHSVDTLWIAESYVKALEENEIHGGHWAIYRNGVEYEEGRWYKYGG